MSRDVEGETQAHKSRHFLHLRQKEEGRLIRRQNKQRSNKRTQNVQGDGNRCRYILERVGISTGDTCAAKRLRREESSS